MNIFLDLETIPEQPEKEARAAIAKDITHPSTMSKPETIEQWHNGEGKYAGIKEAEIDKVYRNTSFDGSKGEVISIAWAVENEEVRCVCRQLGESEATMLREFYDAIHADSNLRIPYFVGHYISEFDLKFLFHRSVVLNVNPKFDLGNSGKHGKDYFDTMIAWAGYKGRISQDNLCKALGIKGKPDDIDGSKVWDLVKTGNVERVAAYNRDDVSKVRQIYNRLRFQQPDDVVTKVNS